MLPMLLFLHGCGQKAAAVPDSYSDWFYNRSDTMLVYKASSMGGSSVRLLDYESMEDVSLCNKPNCTHKTTDCIVNRLGDNVPVFGNGKAYYFINDPILVKDNDEGKRVYQLGTTLYSFDMTTNMEEKLCHVDGGLTAGYTGWLLHDNKIYFVENEYSKNYDENGNATGSYTNVGGVMRLCAVDLSDMSVTDYGRLSDIDAIKKYYPQAPYSGEAKLDGIFDGKLWISISFVADLSREVPEMGGYVISFDLSDNSFHGAPDDLADLDHARVRYLSADYMAVMGVQKVNVYKTGESEPITIQDDIFNLYSILSVFDDKLFCEGKVFDLNTLAVTEPDALKDKKVLAKYGDSYIYSYFDDEDHMDHYGKMSAAEIFGGDTP